MEYSMYKHMMARHRLFFFFLFGRWARKKKKSAGLGGGKGEERILECGGGVGPSTSTLLRLGPDVLDEGKREKKKQKGVPKVEQCAKVSDE